MLAPSHLAGLSDVEDDLDVLHPFYTDAEAAGDVGKEGFEALETVEADGCFAKELKDFVLGAATN